MQRAKDYQRGDGLTRERLNQTVRSVLTLLRGGKDIKIKEVGRQIIINFTGKIPYTAGGGSGTKLVELIYSITETVPMAGITAIGASKENKAGTGSLNAASATTVTYTAPGDSVGSATAIANGETKAIASGSSDMTLTITRTSEDDLSGTATIDLDTDPDYTVQEIAYDGTAIGSVTTGVKNGAGTSEALIPGDRYELYSDGNANNYIRADLERARFGKVVVATVPYSFIETDANGNEIGPEITGILNPVSSANFAPGDEVRLWKDITGLRYLFPYSYLRGY